MAAAFGANQNVPDDVDVPLLQEDIEAPPQLHDRVEGVLHKLRDQWMELSGFRKDPRTGFWATSGGASPEGAKCIGYVWCRTDWTVWECVATPCGAQQFELLDHAAAPHAIQSIQVRNGAQKSMLPFFRVYSSST